MNEEKSAKCGDTDVLYLISGTSLFLNIVENEDREN